MHPSRGTEEARLRTGTVRARPKTSLQQAAAAQRLRCSHLKPMSLRSEGAVEQSCLPVLQLMLPLLALHRRPLEVQEASREAQQDNSARCQQQAMVAQARVWAAAAAVVVLLVAAAAIKARAEAQEQVALPSTSIPRSRTLVVMATRRRAHTPTSAAREGLAMEASGSATQAEESSHGGDVHRKCVQRFPKACLPPCTSA